VRTAEVCADQGQRQHRSSSPYGLRALRVDPAPWVDASSFRPHPQKHAGPTSWLTELRHECR